MHAVGNDVRTAGPGFQCHGGVVEHAYFPGNISRSGKFTSLLIRLGGHPTNNYRHGHVIHQPPPSVSIQKSLPLFHQLQLSPSIPPAAFLHLEGPPDPPSPTHPPPLPSSPTAVHSTSGLSCSYRTPLPPAPLIPFVPFFFPRPLLYTPAAAPFTSTLHTYMHFAAHAATSRRSLGSHSLYWIAAAVVRRHSTFILQPPTSTTTISIFVSHRIDSIGSLTPDRCGSHPPLQLSRLLCGSVKS